MARGAWIRRASVIGLALAIAACEDAFEPPSEMISLEIVPSLQGPALEFVMAAENLRILIEIQTAGAFSIVADTTVAIDPVTGQASADVQVPLIQDPQTYRVTLQALQPDGSVLFAGMSEVTISRAEANNPVTVEVPVVYAGPPFAQLVIMPRDTVVQAGANFALVASAIDSSGSTTTPAPLVTFSLLNPADSAFMTIDATGAVVVAPSVFAAEVVVQAMTPDSIIDHALIQIGDFPPVRRQWVVNPAAAQPWPTQFGTDNFPFATINRGIQRAQIRDTVFVAVRIKRMRFQGANAGLTVRATALNITSTQFQNITGTALFITQSGFTIIDGITISEIAGGSVGRGIQMFASASLTLRNAIINGTDDSGIRIDSVGVVDIARTDIQQTGRANEIIYGIELVFVDSALVDSTKIYNTVGGGLGAAGIRTFTARGDSILNTHVNAVEPNGLSSRTSVFLLDVANSRVVDAAILDNTGGGILVRDSAVNANTTIENSHIEGLYWGVWGEVIPSVAASVSNISIINSTIRGQRGQTRETAGMVMRGMQSVTVTGTTIDSITGWGMYLMDNANVTVDNNTVTDIDDVGGSPFIFPAIHTINVASTGRFTNNQLRRNGTAAFLFTGVAADVLVNTNVIDSNQVGIRLDSAAAVGVNTVTASSNQISNSTFQGVLTLEMGGNFQGNNIFGNTFGVDNQTQTQIIIDATNSWWGDPAGPSCGVGATDCNVQSPGDAVSVNVTASPFATAPVTPPPSAGASTNSTTTMAAARLGSSQPVTATRVPALQRTILRGYIRP